MTRKRLVDELPLRHKEKKALVKLAKEEKLSVDELVRQRLLLALYNPPSSRRMFFPLPPAPQKGPRSPARSIS